jgi:hypothetical protein
MRWLFCVLLGAVALGPVPAQAQACQVPIAYAIGEVDARFDLSRPRFREAVRDAARLWEAAAERELFVHRPGAEFRIHLRYGAIQQATARIRDLEADADALRQRIAAGKERLREARRGLRRAAEPLEERVRAFNREQEAFRARVRRLKKAGDPSARQARALRERQRELQQRAEELRTQRARIAERQQRVQRLAAEVNALVEQHNRRVRKARELAGPDRQLHQGRYERRPGGLEQITVNHFDDPAQLRFVLAHELGHALGLGHVDEPRAVMHYLNEDADDARPSLTAADRAALRRACGP